MFKYYKNDKEFEQDKAIEEMTDYLFGNAISHDTQFKGDCRSIARDLYNAGYRKIPENAVVLTREEYDSVKDSVDLLREYESVSNSLIKSNELCRKLVEDKKELKRQLKQAGKETAEKFAVMLKGSLDISVEGYSTSEVINEIEDKIDEICKEIIGEEK
jgi:hypothetical protein